MDLAIALDTRFLHLYLHRIYIQDILEKINEKINYDNGFLKSEKYDLKPYKKKCNRNDFREQFFMTSFAFNLKSFFLFFFEQSCREFCII